MSMVYLFFGPVMAAFLCVGAALSAKGGMAGRAVGDAVASAFVAAMWLLTIREFERRHYQRGRLDQLDGDIAKFSDPPADASWVTSYAADPGGPAQDGAGADLPRSGIPLIDHDFKANTWPAVDACDKRVSDNPDGRNSRQCGRPRTEHREPEGGK